MPRASGQAVAIVRGEVKLTSAACDASFRHRGSGVIFCRLNKRQVFMADENPLQSKTFNQQLLAGGRAHPVIGWVVLGLGVGAAFGASENNDMGLFAGLGAVIGFGVGILITRWSARRRYERSGK